MTHAFLKTGDHVEAKQRCTKRAYASRQEARRHMNRGVARNNGRGLVAVGKGLMNVYRCQICGLYHLGHKS